MATFGVNVLRVCLSVFDETLHVSFYWYDLFIPAVCMSGYSLITEHALEESIFFGTTFVTFSSFVGFLQTKLLYESPWR